MIPDETEYAAIQATLDLDIIKLRYLSDDEIKKKDNQGRSAVHAAAYKGNVDILNYLIKERNLDPHLLDNNGCSVALYCCGQKW